MPQLSDVLEVLAGVDRSRGAILSALVPNKKGAIRAAEAKVDEIVVFVSASQSHNKKNVNRTVDESLEGFDQVAEVAAAAGIPVHGAIATAFGCPFEGNVPVEQVGKVAKHFQKLGFEGFTGDTTGMATPPLVAERCRYLQDAVRICPLACISTTPAALGWSTLWLGWMRVSTSSRARSAASADAPSPQAQRGISAPKISSTCCMRWGSRPASICHG